MIEYGRSADHLMQNYFEMTVLCVWVSLSPPLVRNKEEIETLTPEVVCSIYVVPYLEKKATHFCSQIVFLSPSTQCLSLSS
mgnify:CR=1 FL=1